MKREADNKIISMWATKNAWLEFVEGNGAIPAFYPKEEIEIMFGKEYKERAFPVLISVHITGTV